MRISVRFFGSSAIAAVLALAAVGSSMAEMQEWTAADGQRKMQAEFISLQGEMVTMRLANGENSTFALNNLNAAGQERARQAAAAAGAEPTAVQQQLAGQLKKLDGERLRSSELGKTPQYFILYYSASWCPPCREMAPRSAEFYRESIATNPAVEMVMVSSDQDDDAAKEWAAEVNMPWPILMYDDRNRVDAAKTHSPNGIPHMVLVDGEGNKLAEGGLNAIRRGLEDLPAQAAR